MIESIEDICFPLHNNARQEGSLANENFNIYQDLITKIGSNTFRLKGNKVFYVPSEVKMIKKKNEIGEDEVNIEGEDETKGIDKIQPQEKLDAEYSILKSEYKLWPLTEKFTFSTFLGLKFTSKFPILSLRNYFGSKVALYFFFMGFLINRLFIIGILGCLMIMAYLAIDILTKYFFLNEKDTSRYSIHDYLTLSQDLLAWIFSIYSFIWGFRMTRDWEIIQKSFQIQNGNTSDLSYNEKDTERVKIKSYYYTRSLVTDELNTKSKNESMVTFRFIVVLLLTLLLILFNIGFTIGILEAKTQFVKNYPDLMTFDEIVNLPLLICNLISPPTSFPPSNK